MILYHTICFIFYIIFSEKSCKINLYTEKLQLTVIWIPTIQPNVYVKVLKLIVILFDDI